MRTVYTVRYCNTSNRTDTIEISSVNKSLTRKEIEAKIPDLKIIYGISHRNYTD